MKTKKILVPVDFSTCSTNALKVALSLARDSRARLILAHFYQLPTSLVEKNLDLPPQMAERFKLEAEEGFERYHKAMPNLAAVVDAEVIHMGAVTRGIQSLIDDQSIDLVVMGTKGTSNRIEDLFGSNTYHVIKKSTVPVLSIPEGMSLAGFKRGLFAADFKEVKDLDQLQIIRELHELYQAKVDILHIGDSWTDLSIVHTEAAAELIQFFTDTPHEYHFNKYASIDDGINQHLSLYENDLLVLIARKHHFPGSLFGRKMTRRETLRARIPLLTIPDTQ